MRSQALPIALTILTFLGLTLLLYFFLHFLNMFPLQAKIVLTLRLPDVLVGFTIYIKTAIDFALFTGNLMHKNPGVKNRIAIELGTALGNAIGTLIILTVWVFFKEVPVLLTLMIVIASFVLLRMAEDGLYEYQLSNIQYPMITTVVVFIKYIVHAVNRIPDPLLKRLLPHSAIKEQSYTTFGALFLFALTIPFLLGLDDFAGYIPLFSIIHVFGFAVGVLLGHMVLTASLFAAPSKTTAFVRQPTILVVGSFVFLGLSLWGFVEVTKAIFLFLH